MANYVTNSLSRILLKTDLDWTAALTKQVTIFKPDGTHIHYIGDDVVVVDAPLGVVYVDFTPTIEGEHLVQAFRALSADDRRHSEFQDFYVSEPIA